MFSRVTLAVLGGLMFLGACGTPQEQCINRSTRELRNLEYLLKETEENLARGYAWEEYEVPTWRREICGTQLVPGKDGPVERPRYCLVRDVETKRRIKSIDPAEEARKRDALKAKIAAIMPQVEANIAACRATYPE